MWQTLYRVLPTPHNGRQAQHSDNQRRVVSSQLLAYIVVVIGGVLPPPPSSPALPAIPVLHTALKIHPGAPEEPTAQMQASRVQMPCHKHVAA